MYQSVRKKEFWNNVRTSSEYTWFLEELSEIEKSFEGEIKASKYSEYKLFFETGSREEYEKSYFDKRRRLNTYAMLCMIYPERKKYLELLQDVIWAICDEYSWALPAHAENFSENDNTLIDLFAAETGFALSEIGYFLEDKLEPLVKSRISKEVHRRIITSYLNRTWSWETNTGNWASVCASHVAGAFIYTAPALFESVKPRIDQTLKYYFSGFQKDGVCAEGIGYWGYGFGSFLCYADLVKEFSEEKYDYFQQEQVKRIAVFLQKCFLHRDVTVSFSDGSMKGKYNVGILHMLKALYPEEIEIPPFAYRYTCDNCARWCYHFRSLIHFHPEFLKNENQREAVFFMPDTGWFIKKGQQYGFAAKGGNNAEPHNHNDIGSFIIAADGEQILCDLGAGEYTRQYFSEKRYDIFCNSSRGHSVPIVNGQAQKAGDQYTGLIQYCENALVIDMTNAYAQNVTVKRRFVFSESSIHMRDDFGFQTDSDCVTERFVTMIKPVLKLGSVYLKDWQLCFDSQKWEPEVSVVKHKNHQAQEVAVYCIDFHARNRENAFEVRIAYDNNIL